MPDHDDATAAPAAETGTRSDRRSVLDEPAKDERDEGWGDPAARDGNGSDPGGRDEDWYRRERPPHHGD